MTNKKNAMISGILLSAVMFLSACGTSTKAETPDDAPVDTNVQTSAEAPEDSAEMTITHELGEVTIEKNPETVVVFDYGILDIMDNLEVEVSGLPMGNIPSFLEKYSDESVYQNVGTLKEPDFEVQNRTYRISYSGQCRLHELCRVKCEAHRRNVREGRKGCGKG